MLNLGNEAYEAVQRLRNNSDYRALLDALEQQQSTIMHFAIDAPVEQRQDMTGYARGLRDVVSMLRYLEKPSRGGQVPRATVRVKEHV